ncbi:MAG TPA: ester cyclase [Burkholderiales bacterium]|nr:ester cyclase [Burkholderiales bacterium]
MTINNTSEAAKAVVRRNTEEVQSGGNFEVFDELFADDFLDHTPQPGRTPDKDGARQLYKILRTAFPDFHAEIHWQLADGDRVTTYKTYHGTHRGEFLSVVPTGRKIQFETVDVMRVRNGKITEHWAWPISSPLCSSSAPGPSSKSGLEDGSCHRRCASALRSERNIT